MENNKIKGVHEVLRGFYIAIGFFLFNLILILTIMFIFSVFTSLSQMDHKSNNNNIDNNSIFEKDWSI